uniref:Uncharacterized protein n=1 Tax=Arundo donax TaxID=35708 RepID=A0A0A9EIA2_ARUDO
MLHHSNGCVVKGMYNIDVDHVISRFHDLKTLFYIPDIVLLCIDHGQFTVLLCIDHVRFTV